MTEAVAAPERQFKGRLARTLLFILLLLSVTPLLVLGSTAYMRARSLLREQVEEMMSAVTSAQADRFDSQVETGRLLLSRSANDPPTAALMARLAGHQDRSDSRFNVMRLEMLNYIQWINQPEPFFSEYFLVLPGGMIHAASDRSWEGVQLGDQFEFSGKKTVSASSWGLTSKLGDELVLLTWAPISNTEGQIVAYITGLSRPPVIRRMIEESGFYTSRNYLVTGSERFIGVNPDPKGEESLIGLQPSEAQLKAFQEGFLTDLRLGVVEFDSYDQEPVIAAYTWIPDLSIGWVAEMPQASLYNQVNVLSLSILVLFLFISIVVAAVLWLVVRRLINPLRTLSDTVRLFAAGDWQQRAPVDRSDEIGLLAYSFNQMAAELSELYISLEARVETRTRQVQATAEVSALATSTYDLEELLDRLVHLIQDRYSYPFVSIYLVDKTGRQASVRQAAGPADTVSRSLRSSVNLDALTLPGWVIASATPRWEALPSDSFSTNDRQDLLPYARAEAGVPVFVAGQNLGAICVQTIGLDGFDEEQIEQLQSIANGIAPALHSAYLLETAQINLEEIRLVYNASTQIAQASDVKAILEIALRTLQRSPYQAALLLSQEMNGPLTVALHTLPGDVAGLEAGAAPALEPISDMTSPVLIPDLNGDATLPEDLRNLALELGGKAAAFLPVRRFDRLVALLVVAQPPSSAAQAEHFSLANLQPFSNLIELIVTNLEKTWASLDLQKGLKELQVIAATSQAMSRETDLAVLYREIHRQIEQILGRVDFYIARFDPDSQMITIPYMTEGEQQLRVDPFPLGEGLTSRLILSRQPLLLTEDVESRAQALGAKGSKSKSWLGVPMLVAGQPTGALVVQDGEFENRFDEDDERLLSTLAGQIALALRNASLLENSRKQAQSERKLFEITNKIRRSTDIRTILQTTATELGTALHANRARVVIHLEDDPVAQPEQKDSQTTGDEHSHD